MYPIKSSSCINYLHLLIFIYTYVMNFHNINIHLLYFMYKLDSTRRKAWEICLRLRLDIYSHTVSR